MSPHPGEPLPAYRRLCALAETLEADAEGRGDRVRADVTPSTGDGLHEGRVTAHEAPTSRVHGRIVATVLAQIAAQDPSALLAVACRVDHPVLGMCRTADLVVLAGDAPDDFAVFGPDAELALDVVGPSAPDNLYTTNPRDYAHMGVPTYALLDPRNGTITVNSQPDVSGDEPRYRAVSRHAFGDEFAAGRWTIGAGRFVHHRF